MIKTAIQWTWNDALDEKSGWTWNPAVGCRKCSTGCKNCYAERLIATRLSQHPVYKGLAVMKDAGPQFTGEHRLIVDRLDEPLRKRNPHGGRTFVNDLGDLFYEGHTNEEIAAVFGVMAAATHHTFQVLTKRAKRMAYWFAWAERTGHTIGANAAKVCTIESINYDLDIERVSRPWPLTNVWLGTSTEDQATADERIPHLLRCPAPVRFLSVEPQVGPINVRRWLEADGPESDCLPCAECGREACEDHDIGPVLVDWIIQGGESGPGARPFDLAWARSMRDQCKAANVAYFLKQLGARTIDHGLPLRLVDSHGGDPAEWPAGLQCCRAFPVSGAPKLPMAT